MGTITIGRLPLGQASVAISEPLGDPIGATGGTIVAAPRAPMSFQLSLATIVKGSDTLSAAQDTRRALRAMMNNTPLKEQAYMYLMYADDSEINGWYVPDIATLAAPDPTAGQGVGLWLTNSSNWNLAGHRRNNKEARQIWLKDLRNGGYERDVLGWLISSDFSALPAFPLSVLPNGATALRNNVTGAAVQGVPLPTGRDGGVAIAASNIADLATVSYERTEASLNDSDVIVYDRRGLGAATVANYVNNPSFEYDTTGSAPAGWQSPFGPSNAATVTVQTSHFTTGLKCCQIVTSGGSTAQGMGIPLTGPFIAGTSYSVSVQLLGNAGGETVQVFMEDYITGLGGTLGINQTLSNSVWTRVTGTWTPTITSTNPAIMITTNGTHAYTFFVDAVQVVQGGVPASYIDGDTGAYTWQTTRGNSATYVDQRPEQGRTNVILNGGFEYDAIGAFPAGWTNGGGWSTIAVQSGWAALGAKSCRFTTPNMNNAAQVGAYPNGPSTVNGTSGLWPVVAGESMAFTFRINVLSFTGNINVKLQTNFYDAGANFLSAQTSNLSSGTGVQTISNVVTAPPTAVAAQPQVTCTSGFTTSSIDFYLDNFMLVYSNALPAAYVDGDSVGYQWAGVAGNAAGSIDPQTFGWKEVLGPDYPWNWLTVGQPNDAPVLDNGLIRVRYDSSNTLGFRMDVWNGFTYVEQGKMIFKRSGENGVFSDTVWLSASLKEWTPDRGVIKVDVQTAAGNDPASLETIYITLQRGEMGATFEIYAPNTRFGTQADCFMYWTPAPGVGAVGVDANQAAMKVDAQTFGGTAGGPATPNGKYVATAGSGSSAFGAAAALGNANFTTSENYISILREDVSTGSMASTGSLSPYDITINAYQVTLVVLQAANAQAQYGGSDTSAYGLSSNAYQIFSQNGAGYLYTGVFFGAASGKQAQEVEEMTLGVNTTNTVDANASNGHAATATRTTDANPHATQAAYPSNLHANFRVFVRMKVSANSASVYVKNVDTTGTTRTALANTGYAWIDLGELFCNGTTLEVHAWMSGGAGTVSIDRIESVLVTDRTRTAFIYSGSRDAAQCSLFDSRQLGSLVTR